MKDLFEKLLHPDAEQRLSEFDAVLQHPFLTVGSFSSDETRGYIKLLVTAPEWRFFCYTTIMRRVVPRALRALFESTWNARFPDHHWENNAASGMALVEGTVKALVAFPIPGWLKVTGPHNIVEVSSEIKDALQNGEVIHISLNNKTHKCKFIVDNQGETRINPLPEAPPDDSPALYSVLKCQRSLPHSTNQSWPLQRRDGRQLDGKVLKKLKTGDAGSWDYMVFRAVLMGCTVELLSTAPHDCKHSDRVTKIGYLRNSFSHENWTTMTGKDFGSKRNEIQGFISDCLPLADAADLNDEVARICDQDQHSQQLPFASSGSNKRPATSDETRQEKRQR